jgi:hypothetical protein
MTDEIRQNDYDWCIEREAVRILLMHSTTLVRERARALPLASVP